MNYWENIHKEKIPSIELDVLTMKQTELDALRKMSDMAVECLYEKNKYLLGRLNYIQILAKDIINTSNKVHIDAKASEILSLIEGVLNEQNSK